MVFEFDLSLFPKNDNLTKLANQKTNNKNKNDEINLTYMVNLYDLFNSNN